MRDESHWPSINTFCELMSISQLFNKLLGQLGLNNIHTNTIVHCALTLSYPLVWQQSPFTRHVEPLTVLYEFQCWFQCSIRGRIKEKIQNLGSHGFPDHACAAGPCNTEVHYGCDNNGQDCSLRYGLLGILYLIMS